MFVDDEPDLLEQAKLFLERDDERLEIDTAVSVEDGLEMFEENDYEAIVSDYRLRERDGLEFLRIVRKEKNSDIPFLIFTGKGREEVAMEALNLDANRYIQKRGDPKSQYGVLADAIIQEVESWNVKTELERAKGETQMLLDNYPNMIFIVAENGRFLRVNKTFASTFGMPREEIEGKMLDELFPEEQAEKMMEDNLEVIRTGEPKLDILEPFETPDGVRWRQADKLPLSGGEEGVIGVVGFARDITERKRAERREEFLRSLLTHYIRNKNDGALENQEALLGYDLPEGAEERVEGTIEAIRESSDMIDKVQTLQRVEEGEEAEEVSVNSCIENAIERCEYIADERGFRIEKDLPDQDMTVEGDLLEDLYVNLMENSIIHSGGSVLKVSGERSNREFVYSVEDDGKGIPEDEREEIFEMGFKKGAESGFGFGLYFVDEIVESYGGRIEVKDSELGGARFDLYLESPER